ncbi:MAG: hypothetical protein EXX96DRAFT_615641 [Benjaminiella poitrasii]|nr:MAG: hypothetical protein EXX96DRAFT_615641 [Benjaminiella poitrasii]
MKATFLTILLTICVAFVFAQTGSTPFYLTNPIIGSSFEAGNTVTLTWINGIDEEATVSLLTGTSSATMNPTGVTFTIQGTDEEYDWTVPDDLPQNATFAFKIDYKDSNGASASTYSSAFTITGTTGDVVTQSFISSNATTVSTAVTALPTSPIVTNASSTAPIATATVRSSSISISRTISPASTPSAVTTPEIPDSGASTYKASITFTCVFAVVICAFFF